MTTTTGRTDEPRVETPEGNRVVPNRGRLLGLGLIAAVIVAVDQASKAAIRAWLAVGEVWPGDFDLIRLARVENTGAAFGILQGGGGFLIVTSAVAIVAIAAFLFWAPTQSKLYTAALALILGGATGNLIDRVTRGSVTDFIDPTHYPAFNVADSSIVVGIATLALLTLLEERRAAAAERASASDGDEAGDGERPW